MAKTHTIITRGLSKAEKNSLKRIALEAGRSVNSIILSLIEERTASEILDHKKKVPPPVKIILDHSKGSQTGSTDGGFSVE